LPQHRQAFFVGRYAKIAQTMLDIKKENFISLEQNKQ